MYCIHVLYWHGDGLLVEQMVKTSHPYNCWPKTTPHRVISVLWSDMTWGVNTAPCHQCAVVIHDLGVNTAPCHQCAVVRHDVGVNTAPCHQWAGVRHDLGVNTALCRRCVLSDMTWGSTLHRFISVCGQTWLGGQHCTVSLVCCGQTWLGGQNQPE